MEAEKWNIPYSGSSDKSAKPSPFAAGSYSSSSSSEASSISKYCTPRSLSRIESMFRADETHNSPSLPNSNIWSVTYQGNAQLVPTGTKLQSSGILPPAAPSSLVSNYSYTLISHAFDSLSPKKELRGNNCQAGNATFIGYRGSTFTVTPGSRFFVIKSYSILDVNSSFVHKIWTSTDLGNKRLNKAIKEALKCDQKVFLLFSVNASGKFCGVAEMTNEVDFSISGDIWVEQTRWKGLFPIEWHLIKDVPNKYFYHLKVPANENKSVTNSRDTQEVPFDIGLSVLRIMSTYK